METALRLLLIPFSLHLDLRFIGDLIAMNHTAKLILFDPASPFRSPTLYPILAYYTMGFFQVLFASLSSNPARYFQHAGGHRLAQ